MALITTNDDMHLAGASPPSARRGSDEPGLGDATSSQRWADYYRQGYWRSEDLWTSISRVAAQDPERVALLEDDSVLRFGEMIGQARAVGAGFRRQGVEPGDVVVIHARNSIAASISLLACACVGAVATPVPPMFSAAQVAGICRSAKPRLLMALGDDTEIARAIEGARTAATAAVIVAADGYPPTPDVLGWSRLAEERPGAWVRTAVDADALALMVYSSGTTGAPKGVMHSSNTLRYAIEQRARLHGVTAGAVSLVASQFGFVGSAVFGLLAGPLLGVTSVLMRSWSGDEAVRLIARHRVDYGLLMPTHVHDILNAQAIRGADLSSFRRCAMGALSRERREIVRQRLCASPLPAYGMSECLGFTSCSPGAGDALVLDTDGHPFPGTEVLIVDEAGAPLPVGVDGEILVRGPSRFLGYYGDAARSAEAITADGYFRTGDLGRLDAHGNIKFVAREKDIIRRGGVTIVPGDLEAVLATHPCVEHVAVIGLPDARLGERACACVITHPGQLLTLEDMQAFLEKNGVARYTWPERVERFDSFPRSASLKVQKGRLVERLLRAEG